MNAKYLIRDMTTAVLYSAGLTKPSRAPREQLTIVTFHRFLPSELRDAYPYREISVTPEMFESFLRFFGTHFRCMTVSDAVAAWKAGETRGKPLVAITVDDGQADNFVYARPLLTRAGIPATFYVTVGAIDEPRPLWHDRVGFWSMRLLRQAPQPVDALAPFLNIEPTPPELPADTAERLVAAAKCMASGEREQFELLLRNLTVEPDLPDWSGMMTGDQIRTLADEGHEIGSHTMTHAILLKECQPEYEREITESRQRLEAMIQRPVRTFSYPNGDYDDQALQTVREAGYDSAVTTRWGPNRRATNPLTLSRFDLQQENNQNRRGRVSRAVLSWRLSKWKRN